MVTLLVIRVGYADLYGFSFIALSVVFVPLFSIIESIEGRPDVSLDRLGF